MLTEIIVTSPDKEVTQIVEKVQRDLNINVSIVEISFESAVSLVKDIISQDPNRIKVVLSGGATLELLRQALPSTPMISIHPTEWDIVLALDLARTFGKELGLFVAGTEDPKIIKKLSTVLGLAVKIYVYRTWEELEDQMKRARRDRIQVVLGVGEKIQDLVNQFGLHFVSVSAGEKTIKNALIHAKAFLEAKIRPKLNIEHLKEISLYTHEGIIVVNEENVIEVFNSAASKLFGLSSEEVIGKSLNDMSNCRCLAGIFDGPEKRLGYIYQAFNGSVLVNKFPIIEHSSIKGILVTCMEMSKVQEELKYKKDLLAKGFIAKYSFSDIIFVNNKMGSTIEKAKKFSNTDCPVLIRGESGTGKELLAQSMHNEHHLRCNGPFIAVNCASFDDNLFKSELFGYTEGSFTGAIKGGKPGLIELANGGTLFLDEIGKMKFEQQGNLLRVLQEKEVRRIGSDRVIPVDVRVIAASNEDLGEMVKKGTFREDLYFRLSVLKIMIPPLRERREDIPCQVTFFLKKYSAKYNKEIYSVPVYVYNKISKMEWPGNSRQLEHLVERCIVLASHEKDASNIMMELLEEEFGETSLPTDSEDCTQDKISVCVSTLAEMNSEIVRRMRAKAKLSNSELALKLGISRPTLSKMLNYS
ncbi:PAS domain S-box [Desulfosporosinus acidiphilus SJ4]|uniref:PAS domain S-box n=1 Tax=Desulfosporosinus acidiphilus (strain DSM 22704 / JCM 16185 / SJ4) TaxID=646529 RepID=I4D665_DESAJ|nr:sigma 54-interacting transcriptional regulator [Desulfosporosinus acidiphilus]AFM41289.1 PAS domain S-box [Desulfosporosinus acidiphilus SJ4]